MCERERKSKKEREREREREREEKKRKNVLIVMGVCLNSYKKEVNLLYKLLET